MFKLILLVMLLAATESRQNSTKKTASTTTGKDVRPKLDQQTKYPTAWNELVSSYKTMSGKKPETYQGSEKDVFSAGTTCKNILKKKPNAPSGTYTMTTSSGDLISVYCEMGLNGGGYTFLTPMSLVSLTDAEVSSMFTDRTTFVLRVRKIDGTQPFAILRQLSPDFATIPLTLRLNSYAGFSPPLNIEDNTLKPPFLFFGFVPLTNYSMDSTIGLTSNGRSLKFKNCADWRHSHFALFSNFEEQQPLTVVYRGEFCDHLFASLQQIPSGRVIPSEFFFFGETLWGGCGCFIQSNQFANITGFIIGFR